MRDLESSVRFYRSFGFSETGRGRMAHGGRFVGLRFPGSPHELELNYYPRANPYYEPIRVGTQFDHLGFTVDDIGAWVRRARRRRLRFVADFVDGRNRLVYVRDPDGNWLEVCGRVVAHPGPR